MKVSNIISDIEYIVPKGTLDKYKYGMVVERESLDSEAVIHQSSQLIESDLNKLRGELGKSPDSTMKLQQVDIVGKG